MIDCYFCKKPIERNEDGVHQYTRGWVKIRSGGGGHGVSLPERDHYFAHGRCIERRIKGWDRQMSLLDLEPIPVKGPPSDEPLPTNAGYEGGLLVHVCNVCGADAPYGIGVAINKGELGQWYCRAHLPPRKEVVDG